MFNRPVDSADPRLIALAKQSSVPGLAKALQRPAGARFYRCALQVNPYEYTVRHAKGGSFTTEAEYNAAIVDACLTHRIEVVGITDHFRIAASTNLAHALGKAGIHVFLGFEASSSEGVHLLCLFPGSTSTLELERAIGACGVIDQNAVSPQSDKTCEHLVQAIPEMGGIAIAAHAVSANGVLTTLRGQSRSRVWCKNLLAIAIAGARADVPDAHRDIVANKDPAHKRERPMAIINANDVSSPEALAEPSATTWIKMAEPSIEGLRQAFLEQSRIRLNSDDEPIVHTEFIAIAWAGGLLDGQYLRLNESLNVLVGGRGAGKSTLIESLRYALELPPKGDDAKRTHESLVKSVLGQGASVAVLVHSPHPSPQCYLIERVFGSRARVRGESGELLQDVSPHSIVGNVEVYGQHEISELTRFPQKLAQLLRRFTEPAADKTMTKNQLRELLERSRLAITGEATEITRIEEALAELPTIEEHLKRFAAAGLDAKLKDKTLIDREARLFERADDLTTDARELIAELHSKAAVDEPLIGDAAATLPNALILARLDAVQSALLIEIKAAGQSLQNATATADADIAKIKAEWKPKQEAAENLYQKTLRQLKADGHDAEKFVHYKAQLERLKPKEAELTLHKKAREKLEKERRELLARWDDTKAEDFRELQTAARRVSKRLQDRVRVKVRPSATLEQLETVIRERCVGNIAHAIDRLRATENLSLTDLAAGISEGAAALVARFKFSSGAADRIASGGFALALEVEECELPPEAVLELNVGVDGAPTWKELDQLSTGQKATAVLLLLLLESDAPLVVDQPEDDLDNRFIADVIVPTMLEEKRQRQFVFSTHNANIPVLGDAEQIIGLTPIVENGVERTIITDELCGSIDTPPVKELVKELLEGGQEAFEFRKQKYGF